MTQVHLSTLTKIVKKLALWTTIATGALFAITLILLLGVPKFPSANIQAENAVVLGAAINTPTIKQRALKALELHAKGSVQTLVFSGGKIAESDISEAEYMSRFITARAQQQINFIIEDQSNNTYQNINNSARLIDKKSPVIIISDEFHLARAVLLAKRAGFDTVYWAAPDQSYYSRNELRFYYVREFFALLRYIPKFIFG